MNGLQMNVPAGFLFIIIPLLLTQSILLFIHAKKHHHYPWFWGIWGLIQAPVPALTYLFYLYLKKRRRKEVR
ncbi:transcriptional regulator [Oceanobacillus sp. CFH 90083]|uniref:transcriptional regulator n=1 Tax=Oceanobacillus sp. CFH 90083 TaxID=2592336 RepID=UPI0018847E21|nr:transcriptional regulator [Oceanobacillus sp. CFH 90083]